MNERHPDLETLARYVRGGLDRAAARDLEEHLASCVDCQARVDALPAPPGAVVRWQGHRFARRPAFQRAAQERRDHLRAVAGELGGVLGSLAEGFLNRLLAESEVGQRALLRDDKRYHSLSLCELLLSRCREAWFDDPPRSVELGRLAVALAGHLDPLTQGPRATHLKALAWMHLGDAYRIAAHWSEPGSAVAEPPPPSGQPASSFLTDAPDRSEEAETALREVRDAFLDRGMDLDAVLATLDLATVYVKQGRADDVQRIAAEAPPLFERRAASPLARTAVDTLAEAAGRGSVTLDLLEGLATRLARARDTAG